MGALRWKSPVPAADREGVYEAKYFGKSPIQSEWFSDDPLYDGHNLVEKFPDLIVVTVGYRTGIMGFIDFSSVPGGEDFATSSNLGLLDHARCE